MRYNRSNAIRFTKKNTILHDLTNKMVNNLWGCGGGSCDGNRKCMTAIGYLLVSCSYSLKRWATVSDSLVVTGKP